ncbi:PREDICTED: uncharacterized protein LOC107067401 [Polistes dominula]|uniref:Uncharacterized protein LOC107067401 n=1 Tax=Polistes dominula TaxID=743375 RepID=A0ABM1IDT0_POLDO|nr:PREDICTED: uncharacterized protein LOC107067401 [Polistes dominula]XP_015178367.1 PREDICTED: uncharacterized protein LOC107067401 [Polistes dominula]XP_015178368.1 PREDICTED: uncharacterized protein LOC107067401 [Polistes dominula]
MLMQKRIIIMAFALLSFAITNSISKECNINDRRRVTCHCDGNQEFCLPKEKHYMNATSLSLSSCLTANLLHTAFMESDWIEEFVVKNISEMLNLDTSFHSTQLKRFELTNIQQMPYIKHDTFLNLENIEHFEMRNVHVDYFEEQFVEIKVDQFVMANVTISNMKGFNFSKKGETLQIIDCEFRNVSTILNFGQFSKVEIVNSKFELQEPGNLMIESDIAIVSDNIFFNVSINIVAVNNVKINNICADGKSSLRLSSDKIESFNNKLPTDIIYSKGQTSDDVLKNNNTICKAGDCKCPKSNGQNANRPITIVFFFQIILFLITCMNI